MEYPGTKRRKKSRNPGRRQPGHLLLSLGADLAPQGAKVLAQVVQERLQLVAHLVDGHRHLPPRREDHVLARTLRQVAALKEE